MTHMSLHPKLPKSVINSIFRKYDKDGNGKLDKKEFKLLLDELGLTKESHQNALKQLADEDGDGNIDYNEFKDWVRQNGDLLVRGNKDKIDMVCKILPIFDEFDKDGDGTITKKEFTKYMKREGYEQKGIDEYWNTIDLDGNGTISFNEFWQNNKQWMEDNS